MIIKSSAVGMTSNRTYSSFSHTEKESLVMRADKAATIELSDESKALLNQLRDWKKQNEAQNKERRNSAFAESIVNNTARVRGTGWEENRVESKEQMQIALLEKILAALREGRHGRADRLTGEMSRLKRNNSPANPWAVNNVGAAVPVRSVQTAASTGAAGQQGGRMMTKITASTTIFSEQEAVSFAGEGIVNTADGRQIHFGIELGLSRAFCAEYEEFTKQDYIVTDPLVINYDTDSASISDQKFFFDLNSDGREEEIAQLGAGSGFLALDKNDDGIINDGSELFGTKSGDGFADLAQYDGDGNGWIDEADDIFDKLRIWTKDEDGTDHLIDLKKAGVGAIYLGNASTQYHLNDDINRTQAVIRSTGVYLRENGEAGTIQHVDMAI